MKLLSWSGLSRSRLALTGVDDHNVYLLNEPGQPLRISGGTRTKLIGLTVLNALMLIASMVLLIAHSQGTSWFERNASLKATHWYCMKISDIKTRKRLIERIAPIIEDIDLPLHDTQFNGTLFEGDYPSVWRLPPGHSAAVDTAWSQFDYLTPFVITRADIEKLGKDPATAVKLEDSYWHLGDDAYAGTLDVFHIMHCVGVLRKAAWDDFGRAGERRPARDGLYWAHMGHCTDLVAQSIACHADPSTMVYIWKETQTGPFMDMSINHKCRSMDTLREWRAARALDEKMFEKYRQPPGAKSVPMERQYFELFRKPGHELQHHHH